MIAKSLNLISNNFYNLVIKDIFKGTGIIKLNLPLMNVNVIKKI